MVNWGQLRHAYGTASDVPALLARLAPEPEADVWEELWSRLCHQGAVYSASFAALPPLVAAAARWKPGQRLMVLSLAAAIIVSDDVEGDRDAFLGPVRDMVPRLQHLASESWSRPGWSRTDFIYLLQAARAFDGDQLWGQRLDSLVGGEFGGECQHCAEYLYLVIGEYGFFTTAEEWLNRPKTPRVKIEPAQDELPAAGQWLHEQARAAEQSDVLHWIRYVFGTSSCPKCGRSFALPDAIAAV
jgi:hypothetical protein